MKTKQLFFTGLFLISAFFSSAQTTIITTTTDITRVGVDSGTDNGNNSYFGYQAGKPYSSPMPRPTPENNTCIGSNAGFGYIEDNNVFIGAGTRFKSLSINESTNPTTGSGNVYIGANVGNVRTDNKLMIDNSSTSTPLIWGDFALDQLKFNGKVGIGNGFSNFPTTAGTVNVSAYNLFVNGGILTEEVRVMLKVQWADYVFEEAYNLPKLEEIETFIKENKHLPNVPSAREVSENGLELGEITTIQQEKIEELTLYLIEQNKINKEQAQQLEKQQSEIDELKEHVKLLLESHNSTK